MTDDHGQDATAKAVIYAAKSTVDVHASIPDQIRRATLAAEAEGQTVIDTFTDEAKSAYSGNRGPGLAAARELAEQEEASLWVLHSDRIARGEGAKKGDAMHLVEYVLWANRAGVRLRSVEDDASLDNLLMAVVMGDRNSQDSKRKSAAVAAGVRRRVVDRQLHHGGQPPYGYQIKRGKLVPLPAEADVVKDIFTAYVNGERQQQIATRLAADSVPTKRPGSRWHQGTVRGILANPIHKGVVHVRSGGEVVEARGKHKPIVSAALWQEAALLRRTQAKSAGGGRGRPADGFLLGGGLLRCSCGEAMVPRTAGKYQRYHCYGRKRSPGSCAMPPVNRQLVDDAVTAYFSSAILDGEDTRRRAEEAAERQVALFRELIEKADRDEAVALAATQRLTRDYLDGKLVARRYEKLMVVAEAEQTTAAEKLTLYRDHERRLADTPRLPAVLEELQRRLLQPMRSAETVTALRVALRRVFASFTLVRMAVADGEATPHLTFSWPKGSGVDVLGAPADETGARFRTGGFVYWLVPAVRDEAVVGGDGEWLDVAAQAVDLPAAKPDDGFVT